MFPTSSGFPAYPIGMRCIMLSQAAPSLTSFNLSVISVSINPGQMALQVIPFLAFSLAAVFVSPMTPAFAAA